MSDRLRAEGGRIAARIPLRVVEAACDRGLDRDALANVLGLDADTPTDAPGTIDADRHFALWEEVMRQLGEPGFPIEVGSARTAEDLDVRGFAVVTSSDGWQAFDRAIRHARITTDTIRYELRRPAADRVRIELHRTREPSLGVRCATECAVASWIRMIRNVLDPAFVPSRVSFRHPGPRDLTTHTKWLGTRPCFGAGYDGFEFDPAVADRVPELRNPAMRAFFDRYADSLVESHSPSSEEGTLAGEIERILVARLSSGAPRMATVAADLGMSERTLRRRLAADSIRYQEVVAQARLKLAKQLLGRPEITQSEAAFLTGFADQSAFSRFFRRQTGMSPGRYRERSDARRVSGGLDR